MAANPTIVFTGPRVVAVEDLRPPEPQAGEVLIRTHCTQISIGAELAVLEGDAPGGETWREMRFELTPGGWMRIVGLDRDQLLAATRAETP